MIDVVCAVIVNNGKVLAAQRHFTKSMPWLWEFPGGKIKSGETASQALARELKEELNIEITVLEPLNVVEHDYGNFQIRLIPFVCKWHSGEIVLRAHLAYRWMLPKDLHTLPWSPADLPVVSEVVLRFSK